MRPSPADNAVVELKLLPFLDLVFATMGILVVIFALQHSALQASGRQLAIDALILCQREDQATLYADPAAAPAVYRTHQFPALLESLSGGDQGVRNLVFALTADCFATRRAFEEAFARSTALPLQERRPGRALVRLAYRPLSAQPGAAEALLSAWREQPADGP